MTAPQRPARRRGAKPRTTREEILRAALRVLDEEGLAGVNLRRVAQDVGVTNMALYGYFESKEDLLAAMMSEAFINIPPPVDEGALWQDQLTAVLRVMHDALCRHPGVIELVLVRADSITEFDPLRDTLIRILRSAGFDAFQSLSLLMMLVNNVLGSTVVEGFRRRSRPADDIERLRALPAGQFPNLREVASEYVQRRSVDSFEFALHRLVVAVDHCPRRAERDVGPTRGV